MDGSGWHLPHLHVPRWGGQHHHQSSQQQQWKQQQRKQRHSGEGLEVEGGRDIPKSFKEAPEREYEDASGKRIEGETGTQVVRFSEEEEDGEQNDTKFTPRSRNRRSADLSAMIAAEMGVITDIITDDSGVRQRRRSMKLLDGAKSFSRAKSGKNVILVENCHGESDGQADDAGACEQNDTDAEVTTAPKPARARPRLVHSLSLRIHAGMEAAEFKVGGGHVNEDADSDESEDEDELRREAARGVLHALENGETRIAALQNIIDEKGGIVDAPDDGGRTAIHIAASHGLLHIVKWLVNEKGVEVRVTNATGANCLHYAAALSGSLDTLEWLLENGLSIEDTNAFQSNLLHFAIIGGDTNVVNWLLDTKGMDINSHNALGTSSIHFAAMSGSLEMCIHLVEERKVDVALQDSAGATAMHFAAEQGNLDCMKWLVRRGLQPWATDKYGQTPLHCAGFGGFKNVVRWLVDEQGCDQDAIDEEGCSVVLCAAERGHRELLEWLFHEREVPLSVTNFFGTNAVHAAAFGAHEEVIEWLCGPMGFDIKALDRHGRNAMHYAKAGLATLRYECGNLLAKHLSEAHFHVLWYLRTEKGLTTLTRRQMKSNQRTANENVCSSTNGAGRRATVYEV